MPIAQGKNLLCYGDNLTFLADKTLLPDESVDLIYLDPPFNSQQNYNVLFKEAAGTPAAAQIKAFEDTWSWDAAANEALAAIHNDPQVPAPLVELMKTFMDFLRPSPMLAYLVQMAIRLVHMHRTLKPTGSLYLHCDPTASHYLKIILDAIFGPANFKNEIVWQRTSAHNDPAKYGRVHDVILFYAKGDGWTWNQQYDLADEKFFSSHDFEEDAEGRKYRKRDLTAPSHGGDSGQYEWKGKRPPKGRMWSYTEENMRELEAQGRIAYTSTGMPRLKIYVENLKGVPLQSVWRRPELWLNSAAKERLGYPTQKPLELLKRIVLSSSNPGDVVFDPFCGCGTTIDAVETLNRESPDKPARQWIGIDITHLSINLIKHRLLRFDPPPQFVVEGEPESVSGAAALAQDDPFQFQYWALGLIGARPIGGAKKKRADRGIDGVRYFHDEQKAGAWLTKRMLVQVKGGHVQAGDIRDFVGTMAREGAEMGVFLTLEESTKPMRTEAAAAGLYDSPWGGQFPRVQILTVEELLKDPQRPNPRCLQVPGGTAGPSATLPEAPKHKTKGARQRGLGFEAGEEKEE